MISIEKLKIENLLTFLPSDNIEIINDSSSDKIKRLSRSIGIESKFVCQPSQTFTDLAVEAIEVFLKKTGLEQSDFDALICVTQSPDFIIPGSGTLLQSRAGFDNTLAAYDINLGCSGFPYGIFTSYSHLLTGMKRVMLVIGDQSYARGSQDEGHGVLFGDSVSIASVILRDEAVNQQILFGTDGGGYKSLYIPHGGKRTPYNENSLKHELDDTGVKRCGTDVVLDGPGIFNFSLRVAPAQIKKLLNDIEKDIEDIDYLVLHQANKIINDTLRKKLKLSESVCPSSLAKYGNTSSGSIPVTLNTNSECLWNEAGKHSIFCGFGIGLSWATMNYISDGSEKSFLEFSKK